MDQRKIECGVFLCVPLSYAQIGFKPCKESCVLSESLIVSYTYSLRPERPMAMLTTVTERTSEDNQVPSGQTLLHSDNTS